MRFETAIKKYPFLERIVNRYPESVKELLESEAKVRVKKVNNWVLNQKSVIEEYQSCCYCYEDVYEWFLVKGGTISNIENSYYFYYNGELKDEMEVPTTVGDRAMCWGFDYLVLVSWKRENRQSGTDFDGEIVIYEK